jgi:hypothetical protein
MALVSTTRGWKGRGRFTVRPLSGGRPFELGNVVSLNESIEVDRTGRQNYQEAAGGELDVDEQITSFTFEATANDISPRNIALGLRGTVTSVGALNISDEVIDAWPSTRIAFRYLPDPGMGLAVVIDTDGEHATETLVAQGKIIVNTEDSDAPRAYMAIVGGTTGLAKPAMPENLGTVADGTVTWKDLGEALLVEDTDYERTPHGLRMMAAADARFPADTAIPLALDYDRNPQYLIQALVDAGTEYEVIWHGLNAVDSGNPVTSRYFRVKFSPTSGFSRHGGDDFAELILSGTVLADETREGGGLSKFLETAMI